MGDEKTNLTDATLNDQVLTVLVEATPEELHNIADELQFLAIIRGLDLETKKQLLPHALAIAKKHPLRPTRPTLRLAWAQ